MNITCVGIVAYADDLLLPSPTLNGLQEMTKTCEEISTILRSAQSRSSKSAKQNAWHFLRKKLEEYKAEGQGFTLG